MKRQLLQSPAFVRSLKGLAKRNPRVVESVETALRLLADNALQPSLATHKLKGSLARSWACSAGYDLRIIFQVVPHAGGEALLLQAVGSHDDVY